MNENEHDVPAGASAKRQVKNYLLDKGFQLGWVARVVVATTVIVAVMGWFLYRTVADATDQLLAAKLADIDLTEAAVQAFIEQAELDKIGTLLMLGGGLFLLVLLLSVVTIIVTHKVAGPVYKMKKLLADIDGEHLQLWAKLRKGDELQDAFREIDEMLRRLRESRQGDIEEIESARAEIPGSGGAAATERLDRLVARYRASVRMD
ncbi:MAG TPA: hypothetical protein VM285_04585 [Polyangia bacterium]|nr:hypothetical protein [Polyangia bacterium]